MDVQRPIATIPCPELSKLEALFPQYPVVPEGLTREARRARDRFNKAYQAQLKRVARVSLSILVWGPHPDSPSPVARKRICIRQALIMLGHNAFFSEEYAAVMPSTSVKLVEYAQAEAADLIVILVEDSPGAMAEVSDFCSHPEIAQKVLVMFPHRLREGYTGQGVLSLIDEGYGGVYWYGDDDLKHCDVLTRAVKRAEARRVVRSFLQGGGR